jgi:hypothetical protein
MEQTAIITAFVWARRSTDLDVSGCLFMVSISNFTFIRIFITKALLGIRAAEF